MARILLIDADEHHAAELVRRLERGQHSAKVCTTKRDAMNELKRDRFGFDIMILDLSADRPEDWQALDQFRGLTGMNLPAPVILCVSRVYRGPRMRLEAERRGARFIYER